MQNYKDLVESVLYHDNYKADRTGTGTIATFGNMLWFNNIKDHFPLLTLKKTNFNAIKHELIWFLQGDTNIAYLNKHGIHIWDAWADKDGNLGPVYGYQWRRRGGIDQIAQAIELIRTEPNSRRIIVDAWNPEMQKYMRLPPCHCMFQFQVQNQKLNCMVTMRSADLFLGLPFDIASYALLTCMIAQVTGLKPGDLVFALGDTHIYRNHITQAKTMIERNVLDAPILLLNPLITDINDFDANDIQIHGYTFHSAIKAPIAI